MKTTTKTTVKASAGGEREEITETEHSMTSGIGGFFSTVFGLFLVFGFLLAIVVLLTLLIAVSYLVKLLASFAFVPLIFLGVVVLAAITAIYIACRR